LKKRGKGRFYLIREDILPEAILKTVQAKEMLARGDALTVNQAVESTGISRSAFYKYRDGILPYIKEDSERVTSLTLLLEHRSGVLSTVLNTVAAMKGNIDSINQSMPVQGVAVATMTINTTHIKDMAALVEQLQKQEGVKRVEVVSQL